MTIDPEQLEQTAKRDWLVIAAWIGGISAVIGFVGTLSGTFGKIEDHFHNRSELASKMTIAQAESQQGDYQAAVQSYAEILKSDSLYAPALEQQLNTTMLWVENFSVVEPEGQDAVGLGGPQLDQIFAILDAALARSKGTQAADVEAHLGWAHWLNRHIAQREFGPIAEHDLRAAIALDASNVYANAMLGNWMLQNGGNLDEAIGRLRTAAASGKERPLIRTMQLGGLISNQSQKAAAEMIRVSNDMRKNQEPLDARSKRRVLFDCFGSSMNERELVVTSLSAVPPDDAYQTYLWLDDEPSEGDDAKYHGFLREFVKANVLEISGNRSAALAGYQKLQKELKGQNSSLESPVTEAVNRLLHSS
jgi:tetratricopeptide (TPR) repeat protein